MPNVNSIHFTLILHSSSHESLSIDLEWVPCLCFKVGGEIIYNTYERHSEHSGYLPGDFAELYRRLAINPEVTPPYSKSTIVVHSGGYGEAKDLGLLEQDLRSNGFSVDVCYTDEIAEQFSIVSKRGQPVPPDLIEEIRKDDLSS